MKNAPLSLDTIRLKWGIVAAPEPKKERAKEIKSEDQVLSAVTKNQLKKRRPKKRRR